MQLNCATQTLVLHCCHMFCYDALSQFPKKVAESQTVFTCDLQGSAFVVKLATKRSDLTVILLEDNFKCDRI